MQHIGQGANQAFEDIYHLVRLLCKHNPSAVTPSTELLSKIFTQFEDLRIPRTSEFVKRARKLGELRVVHGVEECKKRNNHLRQMEVVSLQDVLNNPFVAGYSEVPLVL